MKTRPVQPLLKALLGFVASWFAALLALVPATGLGGLALACGMALMEAPHWRPADAGFISFMVVMALICAIPLGAVFSVLALPLLPFRRWIVGEEPPFLKPGYVAVALYGPAIILIANQGRLDGLALGAAATYEVIALAATLLYPRIAKALGLTRDRPDNPADVFG